MPLCRHKGLVAPAKSVRNPMSAELKRLLPIAHCLNFKSEDLDDFVHATAQAINLDRLNTLEDEGAQNEHILEVEVYAAEINIGGVEDQLEFLLRHNSFDEVERMLAPARRST